MLKKLRNKKTAKRIWIMLTLLIMPAFVFWGFGNFIRSKEETMYVGKIFGRRVTFLEYKEALNAVRNQAIIHFGDNLSEIQKLINFESEAWNRLLLLAEAKKRKITANDAEVIGFIKKHPLFKGRDGQFYDEIYSRYLEHIRTQPRIFEEETRQNLVLSKLYGQITKNLNLTEEEIGEEYRKLNEQVSIYYIASAPSEFIKDITTSEEELKDYFAKNSLPFKEPLSFNVEYVYLPADEQQNEETPKDKIKKLTRHLNKKADFLKVAGDFGLQVKETGLFGQTDPIPGIGWSPQISNLISKLKIGEFSSPIHWDKYYYVMRLKDRREPYIPDFPRLKDKIKDRFIKDKSQEIAKERIENCLKKLNELYQTKPESIDFNNLAKIYGLKSDSTDFFKYGSYIEGIGSSDIFFAKARGLKEKNFSEIINTPSAFYIIKVKALIPEDEKKFAEEKPEFSARLLLQKKEDYFNNFVEELKTRTQ